MQTDPLFAIPPEVVASRRPKPKLTAITPGDLPIERVLRWERERPDSLAMVQPLGGGAVREYTWNMAVGEARRLAAYLRSLGLPPRSRVAILSKNCAHFLIMDLAIWMGGYVSVPLYPTLEPDAIRYVLEHCDAKAIFVGKLDGWDRQKSGIPAHLRGIACELSPPTPYERWEDIVERAAPLGGHPVRRPEDIATIIYTSGSTGLPKGVMHDFQGIAAAIKGAVLAFGLSPEDRMISYLPLAHAFERTVVESCSFVVGFPVYFVESLDTFVRDIQRARPTLFHSVPRLWLKFQVGVHAKMPPQRLRLLLRVPLLRRVVAKEILRSLGLDQTRAALTGSAPIPAELVAWYRALGLELCEGYGMTENFSYSHFDRPGDAVPGTVGRPAPDVEHKLGEDGEVLVKSPANMVGYFREPELTKAAFTEDGFLRTGDCGIIEPDGRLRIIGRTKELFKTSKGKYVAPAPIESALQASGLIELACVTGTGLPQPVAVVSLAEDLRAKAATAEGRRELEPRLLLLLETVNATLSAHERLDRLYVSREAWTIESGLLTPTLKIKRAEIDKRYRKQIGEEGPPIVWIDEE